MTNASIKNSNQNNNGDVAAIIREKITNGLAVVDISVVNDSARHANHVAMKGVATGGQSHFIVNIVSDDFIGLNRIERQRKIYGLLMVEMQDSIHALNLSCLTVDEAKQ